MNYVLIFFVLIQFCALIKCQTKLDFKLLPFVRLSRTIMADFVKPRSFEVAYRVNAKNNKVQKPFINQSFFCDVHEMRSRNIPMSVHQLRPGDIDIVGAIGDSLTAGNGAFAIDNLQTTIENRGVVWSIGGRGSWREFVTLPNILKEFNPKLYGFSSAANSLGYQKASKFNVAEPTAISSNGIRQAKNLVKRMRSDLRVDMENHWKLVTIMIGSNDFCFDVCEYSDQNKLVDKAGRDMIQILRILRENLPRTLVNVVIPVDVSLLFQLTNTPAECQGFHYAECPCMVSPKHQKNLKRTINTFDSWKKRIVQVIDMNEFHTNTFEVTIIKFTDKLEIPKVSSGQTDYTFFSKDCFHLSQKGHSLFGKSLWNAMMTSENERKTNLDSNMSQFICPSYQHPYLRTRKN